MDRPAVKSRDRGLLVAAVAGLLVLGIAAPAGLGAAMSNDRGKLPPGALRGPIDRLRQYPTLSLATAEQRAAAAKLLSDTRIATRPWVDPRAAAAAGFSTRLAPRQTGDRSAHWLHAEQRLYLNDDLYLDPHHPETLIYANVPGHPLVLIGVMYGVKRGMRGPTPGGPITRWHTHRICANGNRRGVAPRPDGSCPRGTRARQGRNEMLHLWLTRDLRSAYAVNAPVPELCIAHLLPVHYCHQLGNVPQHSH
jgi:hypothetical protein